MREADKPKQLLEKSMARTEALRARRRAMLEVVNHEINVSEWDTIRCRMAIADPNAGTITRDVEDRINADA